MPREAVHGERLPHLDADLPESISSEEFEQKQPIVDVRWSRWPNSHVQVVTRLKGCEVFFSEDPSDLPTCDYGMYVTLDRDGINRLIRNLRRARDQAFGRDE